MVNLLGVTEPMIGWKQAPLSAVASRLLVRISVFMLCTLNWEQWMHVCIYISINGLCIETVKLCLYVCFLENSCFCLILPYAPV